MEISLGNETRNRAPDLGANKDPAPERVAGSVSASPSVAAAIQRAQRRGNVNEQASETTPGAMVQQALMDPTQIGASKQPDMAREQAQRAGAQLAMVERHYGEHIERYAKSQNIQTAGLSVDQMSDRIQQVDNGNLGALPKVPHFIDHQAQSQGAEVTMRG